MHSDINYILSILRFHKMTEITSLAIKNIELLPVSSMYDVGAQLQQAHSSVNKQDALENVRGLWCGRACIATIMFMHVARDDSTSAQAAALLSPAIIFICSFAC